MGLFEMGYSYVDTVSHGGPFRDWLVKEVVGKRYKEELESRTVHRKLPFERRLLKMLWFL